MLFRSSLRRLLPGKKITLLLGILADKDAGDMLDLLVPLAERVFVLRPDSPRAIAPETLSALMPDRRAEAPPCARAAGCRTLAMWQGLDQVIREYLDQFTIADLMQAEQPGDFYVI